MLKNMTHKDKFVLLKKWMPIIVDSVKKDLKNEHLKKDPGFVKRYFPGKNPNKLTAEEVAEAYLDAIEQSENAEELGEFISNRWLLKHSDLYYYFETELSKISPDFNEIEELDKQKSVEILEGAIHQFGTLPTYLFCVMNSVVFPKEVYDDLSGRAAVSVEQAQAEAAAQAEAKSAEQMQRSYELQIARLTDKYEKKLGGLQKKYAVDVDSLKKQIVALQRQLAAKG